MKGYIVVEQEFGCASFYTVKYDFQFKNNVDAFAQYGLSDEELALVEKHGCTQADYTNVSGTKFVLTIIKMQ